MTVRWERFFSFRFDGERFRATKAQTDKRTPGLDLRDLEELIAVREAMFDLAEFVWRRNNPRRKNLPADFRKQIEVRFFDIEPGSSIVPLERPVEVEASPDSGVRRRGDELPEAARILTASWRAAIKDEQPPYQLPEPTVEKIKRIGSTRAPNELVEMETLEPPREHQPLTLFVEEPIEQMKVTLDSAAREKGERNLDAFKTAYGVQQTIEQDDYELVCDVTEADRRSRSAQLLLDGKPIPVKLTAAQLHDVTLALHKDLDFRLHIIGTVLLDAATGRVLRVKSARSVRCVPKPNQLSLFSWNVDPADDLPSGETLDSAASDAIKGSVALPSALANTTLPSVSGEQVRDAHEESVARPTWEAPCEDMFEWMADNEPGALLELIRGGTLEYYDLTFAAEIAGRIADHSAVVQVLMPLLDHPEPVVREGAIYGLARHVIAEVIERIRDIAANDNSPGVRKAARGLLEDVE
jgi:hypothetical protein